MITHIVLVKFTPGSTTEQKSVWKSEIQKLNESVSVVKDLKVGRQVSIDANAKSKDGGWEDGMVMTFDNLEDLRTYATSEAHDVYIKATASITADKLIYDIET